MQFLKLLPKRIVQLPVIGVKWYAERVARVRERNVAGWALLELLCMTLSILPVLILVYLWLLGWPSGHFLRLVLPVSLAGAVGYTTNLLAVTMLFRPYGSSDTHPIGLIPFWSEGLVPKNKEELAKKIGRQVGEDLVTPDAIVEGLENLMESIVEDPDLQRQLHLALGPMIRERLPSFIDNLLPETMKFLRDVATDGFSEENVARFFDEVLAPQLDSPGVADRIADEAVQFMEEKAPLLVDWIQEMADAYRESGFWQKARLWVAELTMLNWDDFRERLRQRIADPSTRQKVLDELPSIRARARNVAVLCAGGDGVERAKIRASDFVAMLVEERLEGVLPELGHRIADDRRFWQWLSKNLVPEIRQLAASWLKGRDVSHIKRIFDIEGRVEREVREMNVEKVHSMINDASARHLGAIQVLGYALGLVAGSLLLLV